MKPVTGQNGAYDYSLDRRKNGAPWATPDSARVTQSEHTSPDAIPEHSLGAPRSGIYGKGAKHSIFPSGI